MDDRTRGRVEGRNEGGCSGKNGRRRKGHVTIELEDDWKV